MNISDHLWLKVTFWLFLKRITSRVLPHVSVADFELLLFNLFYLKIFSPVLNSTEFEDKLAKHLKKCN